MSEKTIKQVRKAVKTRVSKQKQAIKKQVVAEFIGIINNTGLLNRLELAFRIVFKRLKI